MADHDKSPVPDFAPDLRGPIVERFRRPNTPEGQGIPARNPNHDQPTLTLPPESDVLSPAQLQELFAEWRADYAAAKAERESPRMGGPPNPPAIDMREPER